MVERELGPTQSSGFEDDEDFNVLLDEALPDDQVNLVSKETGELHRELYFGNEERLAAMTPVGES